MIFVLWAKYAMKIVISKQSFPLRIYWHLSCCFPVCESEKYHIVNMTCHQLFFLSCSFNITFHSSFSCWLWLFLPYTQWDVDERAITQSSEYSLLNMLIVAKYFTRRTIHSGVFFSSPLLIEIFSNIGEPRYAWRSAAACSFFRDFSDFSCDLRVTQS